MPKFELTTLIALAPCFIGWLLSGNEVFVWLMIGIYFTHLAKKIAW